ncbi:hypothetical protein CVUC_01285 [Caulobacter vibrioides]|nr:hypothetical protein CVUC_01285 [Caulobacter vibrioides]
MSAQRTVGEVLLSLPLPPPSSLRADTSPAGGRIGGVLSFRPPLGADDRVAVRWGPAAVAGPFPTRPLRADALLP